jgi:hypothetical protein
MHDIEAKKQLAERISLLAPIEVFVPEAADDIAVYKAYLDRSKGWRQKAIEWALAKLPASVMLSDGEVFFTRSSIRNALAHGKGKLKLLTIPYIAVMLKPAVLFYSEVQGDFTFYNYAHPFISKQFPIMQLLLSGKILMESGFTITNLSPK